MIDTQVDYQAPETLDAALQLMDQQGYQLLNRGRSALRSTDIKRQHHKLVSLRKVTGLGSIQADASALQIGALVTYDQLLQHPAVQACSALAQALRATPEPHQLHSNTLGGAVHEGGPSYAPVLAALMALDATAQLASRTGTTSPAIAALGHAGKRLPLAVGNLMSQVTVPTKGQMPSAYIALDPVTGRRPYLGMAVALALVNGQVQYLRLVLAGFSDFPVRLTSVEAALNSGPLTPERLDHAVELLDSSALQTSAQPAEYWLHLARVLVRKALATVS